MSERASLEREARPPDSVPMKLASVEAIVRALADAEVRYLIAGGLAVNAHGFLRFTKDIDVILHMETENVLAAFAALADLGYRPNVPVTAADFADAETRGRWIRDKGMQVLQLWSDAHPQTPIDLFVSEPVAFESEYENALIKSLYGEVPVRFVSLPTLIAMKEAAGRTQDLVDIENLRSRLEGNDDEQT